MTSFLSQISLVAAMAASTQHAAQYGALDPIFGQAQYAQIPMAVVGIVMKVLSDCDLDRCRYGGGVHTDCGFNMGAEI